MKYEFTGSLLHLASIYHILKLNLPIFFFFIKISRFDIFTTFEKKKEERTVIYNIIVQQNIPFYFPYYLQVLFYFVPLLPFSVFAIPFLSLSQLFFRPVHIPFRSFFTRARYFDPSCASLFIYISLPPVFHPSSLFFFLPFHLFFHSSARYFVPYLSPPPSPSTSLQRVFSPPFYHRTSRFFWFTLINSIRFSPFLVIFIYFHVFLISSRCLFFPSYSFSFSLPFFRFSFSPSLLIRSFLFPLAIIFLSLIFSFPPFLNTFVLNSLRNYAQFIEFPFSF